jgi:hypothetical protein
MSRHALALNQPGQFAVLDVEGFPILRHWYAVCLAGRRLSVVARAFLDYLLGRWVRAPGTASEKKSKWFAERPAPGGAPIMKPRK